jgi:CHAT domain-containing protein
MKELLKISICLLYVLAAHTLTQAQIPGGAEGEFEQAVSQYTVSYQNLLRSRGVSSADRQRRRRVPEEETQREISESFYERGAPPLSEYVNSSSLSDVTGALRNNFPPRTALLFYAYRESRLQIWLVDQSGLQSYSVSRVPRQKLETAIYGLRNALGVDSLQLKRSPQLLRDSKLAPQTQRLKIPLRRAIARVTAMLLPTSVASQLKSVEHLIVAPILSLGTVPFAILRPFKSKIFLIDKMSLSVVPSLFDIESSTRSWTPGLQNPLIVGNPYLPPNTEWIVPPLPGAEEEARTIAQLVNARPLIGREATKQAVIAKAGDADFLYFATHGVANSEDPLRGGFLFLSAEELTEGFWTARDVQSSKLKAQIAVLSACQTGLGKVHDAGVIGLSRAFQIAGVPRVVMSLWSVNDKATAELMKSFVKYLQQYMPAEALRLAMLDVRKRRPEPSQWASFVLFGTPR